MRPTEVVIGLDRLNAVQLPAMLWGSPGIGKSSVIHEIGNEQNRKIYDIRLALLDPTDLRGIPFYNPKTNSAEWAPSSILPKELPRGASVGTREEKNEDNIVHVVPTLKFEGDDPDKPYIDLPEDIKLEIARDQNAILFLDEINAAPPVIQAASYQLVLDRRIGEYRLPDGVSIIAAGNNEGDKAVTFKMPTPLTNRFVHIDFEVNFEDWHDWAVAERKIKEDVVGFLNFKKGYLNKFDPNSKSRGFPTPRSWSFVSRILDPNMPESVLRGLVGGAVGDGAAIEFMKYREIHMSLPDPGDVLDGKVAPIKDPGLSASYAMITSLSYELSSRFEKMGKTKEFLDMAATYFEFIHDSYKPEFCVMGVRDTLKNFKLPMVQAPNWKKFAKSYTKFVMAA